MNASGAVVAVSGSVVGRRVPLGIEPEPDEALRSWLVRSAWDSLCPPGVLARALGLPVRPAWRAGARVRFFGVQCSPAVAARVAAATGLVVERVEAMHLQRYDGSALNFEGLDPAREATVSAVAKREWFLPVSSRACPPCLVDRPGVWPLWWKLGYAACCPVHAVLLVDRCDRCEVALTKGYVGYARGLSTSRLQDPTLCDGRVDGAGCDRFLGEVATVPVPRSLVAVQQLVVALAAAAPAASGRGGASGLGTTVAGRSVSSRVWFAVLRDVAALVRVAGPDAVSGMVRDFPASAGTALLGDWSREMGSRNTGNGYRSPPASAALTAALLLAAAPALAATSEDEFLDALRPVAVAYRAVCTARRLSVLRERPFSAPVQEALALVAPPRQGRFVAGARDGARELDRRLAAGDRSGLVGREPVDAGPQGGGREGGRDVRRDRGREGGRVGAGVTAARFVPQLLPHAAYHGEISTFLPGTAEVTGRRFAALSAVRIAGAANWATAADELGLDRVASIRCGRVVSRRLADPAAYWQALAHLVARLVDEQVDFRARERFLAPMTCVPFSRPRWPVGTPWAHVVTTPARGRYAAAWVWTTLACAHWADAPAMSGTWPAVKRDSHVEAYRRVRVLLDDLTGAALTDWATVTYLGDEQRDDEDRRPPASDQHSRGAGAPDAGTGRPFRP